VQESANGVPSRVRGQAVRHELEGGACCDGAVGVGEVVGALRDDQEMLAERECTNQSRIGSHDDHPGNRGGPCVLSRRYQA
jgi:hypothetical protein